MTKSKKILIKNPIERFWRNIKLSDDGNGCWVWIGRKSYKGYGRMKIKNKHIQAHRFSYELFVGDIPAGMLVCHGCDNPGCVNPNHLFVGTIQDNNTDRDDKGRKALGERNGKSKLSVDDVKAIREMIDNGYSDSKISKNFPVCYTTIRAIRIRRTWSHVQ